MGIDLHEKLSDHFTLGELLASAHAERDSALKAMQHDPPAEVLERLRYLCTRTLEPLRQELGYPIHITSGYRCPKLNRAVRGSPTSQHVLGEAADCKISSRFLTDPKTRPHRQRIREKVAERIGDSIHENVTAEFYLFAAAALGLEELDLDQAIHEYGEGPGRPAWVHLSASAQRNRREIVVLGPYAPPEMRRPKLEDALRLGTRAGELQSLEGEALQQGTNPAEFIVKENETVCVDVEAHRTGTFVTGPESVEVIEGSNMSFRFSPSGGPGARRHLPLSFEFVERHDPPAHYEVKVSGGGHSFAAPSVFQPPVENFPCTVPYVLTFVVSG